MALGLHHTSVDIENIHGVKFGSGPLTHVVDWKVKREMDRSSDWQVRIAATDPQIEQVRGQRYIAINALVGDRWQYVGGGQINKIKREIPKGGTMPVVTITGFDNLYELGWTKVTFDASGNLRHILESILPDTWTITGDVDNPPYNELYVTAEYDNRLNLLNRAVGMAQTHFRLDGRRTLYITDNFEDSGLVAVDALNVVGSHTAAIKSLSLTEDSDCLYGAIRPLGSGNSGSSLTLRSSNKDVRPGMTIDRTANIIRSTRFAQEFEADIGERERTVKYNEVTQATANEIDLVAASNQLQASAEYTLSLIDHVHEEYAIQLTDSNVLVNPLETIRVTYADAVQNLNIDRNLFVLATEWKGGRNGIQTARLTVANMRRYSESGSGFLDILREKDTESRAYRIQRQRGPSIQTDNFSWPLDKSAIASSDFFVDESVLSIENVKMRTKIKRIVSPVRATVNNRVTSDNTDIDDAKALNNGGDTYDTKAAEDFDETAEDGEFTVTISTGDDLPDNTEPSAAGVTGKRSLEAQQTDDARGTVTVNAHTENAAGTATTVSRVETRQTTGGNNPAVPITVRLGGPTRSWSQTSYRRASLVRGSVISIVTSGDVGGDPAGGSGVSETEAGRLAAGAFRATGTPIRGGSIPFRYSVPALTDYNLHSHIVSSSSGTLPTHFHNITAPPHNHSVLTNIDHSHTATAGLHDHNVPAAPEHDHSIPAHSHPINIELNASHVEEAHSHALASHDHEFTIPDHEHELDIPTHNHAVLTEVELEFGIYQQNEPLLKHQDLEWRVNRNAWIPFSSRYGAVAIENDWVEVDITELVQDPRTFRQRQNANVLEIRKRAEADDGLASITIAIVQRNVIQSTALTQ